MGAELQTSFPKAGRYAEVEFLNKRLAEAIDLVYQAKQAHWNVKGYEFRSLHKLFDEVAEAVEPFVDLLAERISQLGGVALGTVRAAASNSSLPEYPLEFIEAKVHIETLCERVAFFDDQVRDCIEQSSDIGDPVTADILTEIARAVDEVGWMLGSHLTGEQAGRGNRRASVS